MAEDNGRRSWSAPRAQGAVDAPGLEKRQRRRPTAGSVVRWTVTGLLLASSVVVVGFAGGAQTERDAAVSQGLEGLAEARAASAEAERLQSALPDAKKASRLLSRMATETGTITEVQNTYVQEAGPLSLEGIPVDRQEPTGAIVVYTEEERTAMAQERRDERLLDLDRSLRTLFARASTDDDGINAATDWTGLVEGLSGTEGVGSAVWTATIPSSFDDEQTATVVWTLRSADGTVLAWATADYRFADGRFGDLRVMSAILAEEG